MIYERQEQQKRNGKTNTDVLNPEQKANQDKNLAILDSLFEKYNRGLAEGDASMSDSV